MDQPIEMVPLPAHPLVQTKAELGGEKGVVWNFCIRIMGPNLMQAHKDQYKGIGYAREGKISIGYAYDKNKNNGEQIFQRPITSVMG